MGRKYTYKRNENHNRNENLVQLKNLVAPDMEWKELRWWWYLRNDCTKKATKWCNESCWNGGTAWDWRRCGWGVSLTWTSVFPIVRAENTLESACGHVRWHHTKCYTCDFPELCFLFSPQPFHLTSKKNDNKILPFIINILITRLSHLSSMW